MSFAFGPLTDCYGMTLTVTPDGTGGFNVSCPKYGSMDVTAAQLASTPMVQELFNRLCRAEDFYINWRNLSEALGLGDPGETQIGSPE